MNAFTRFAGFLLFLGCSGQWVDAAPQLVAPNPVYDFGELPNTRKVEHQFIVQNNGTEPLEVKKIRSTCGCTVARAPDEVILPGEEGYVTATFNLVGREGPQEKKVTIYSNDPESPKVDLIFRGIALQTLRARPQMLVLGRIPPKSEMRTRNLAVTSPDAFAITDINVDGEGIRVKPEFQLGETSTNFTFIVTIDPSDWDGEVRHTITLHTTSVEHPKVEVPVAAYVAENPY